MIPYAVDGTYTTCLKTDGSFSFEIEAANIFEALEEARKVVEDMDLEDAVIFSICEIEE